VDMRRLVAFFVASPEVAPARTGRILMDSEVVEVAPGGVEPPHTDSKSVALSAELRGLNRGKRCAFSAGTG
jgi:hypothetical protein